MNPDEQDASVILLFLVALVLLVAATTTYFRARDLRADARRACVPVK